ncbi:MAG TPA: NTP transferase domain-containing protein, partial [Bacteroidales bacterium]|nr:NTP transferase domain-containing protein [Bacteroidales bacterium]
NLIIKSYRETRKGIIVPVYGKKRGHPVLIDRRYADEIHTLEESQGLRSLLKLHREDVFEVKTSSPGILKDFDTKEDYLNELNKSQ